MTALSLVDTSGRILADVPHGAYRAADLPISFSAAPQMVWPEHADGTPLFSAVVPCRNSAGEVWAYAVVRANGHSRRSPFVPVGLHEAQDDDDVSPILQYNLEVIAPSGAVVLGIGPEEYVGVRSPHYSHLGD